MKLGARVVKTGLAIVLALYVARFLGLEPIIFAAIAATLTIQPSLYRSWNYLKEVIISNLIGVTFSLLMINFLGSEPFIIGLTVIFVIALNLKLKLEKTVSLSVLTVIAIMESPTTDPPLMYSLFRFSTIMIGIASSMLINALFMPPKYEHKLFNTLNEWHKKMCLLLRNLSTSDLTAKAVKDERLWLKNQRKKANDLFDLHQDERKAYIRKPDYQLLRKMVIFRQMIKTLNKQKSLYQSLDFHYKKIADTVEINDFLSAMTTYQERIFMKFEGKIKHSEQHQRDELLDEMSKKTITEVMKLYDPNRQDICIHVFPIVSDLVTLLKELEYLDLLVDSYQTYQQKSATKV